MPRGFVWGVYLDDLGVAWRLRVDADYATHAERGWVEANPEAVDPLPRQWVPRRVVGVDDEGRRRAAVVATTSAELWTGAVSTFEIEGSDQLPHAVVVTELNGERRQ